MSIEDEVTEHKYNGHWRDLAALVVVIAGTTIEVGKKWIVARITEGLRYVGMVVEVRKPVQSRGPRDPGADAAVVTAYPNLHCSNLALLRDFDGLGSVTSWCRTRSFRG